MKCVGEEDKFMSRTTPRGGPSDKTMLVRDKTLVLGSEYMMNEILYTF